MQSHQLYGSRPNGLGMKRLSTNNDYWQDLLKRHRTAKMLRIYKEKNKLSYAELSKTMGFSRQYIYGVEQTTVIANPIFKEKLERLLND